MTTPAIATLLTRPVVSAIAADKVNPGVLGFLVVAALGVATFLLIRSMNRQMRKVDFDEDAVDRERRGGPVAEPESAAGRTDGPDEAAGSDRQPG